MAIQEWQQQGKTPLFPDIVWNRPENKLHAGRLLIVGGNTHGFAAPALAYKTAQEAGIGTMRIVLPEGLRSLIGHLPDTYFAPQNPSGSFSRRALDELLLHASWSEGVLLAGELGRNSETATILESFTKTYNGQLTLTKDAVDYFVHTPEHILRRPDTCIVLSVEQLQKFGIHTSRQHAITLGMPMNSLVEWLHYFTNDYAATIVTLHNEYLVVAQTGRIVTHKRTTGEKVWRVETAARSAVFMLQHPKTPFEAVVTSFV